MTTRLLAFCILAAAFLIVALLVSIERRAARAERRIERQEEEISALECGRPLAAVPVPDQRGSGADAQPAASDGASVELLD